MRFELTELRGSTVWNVYRMRHRIQLDPDYQRMSDIWTIDKRQGLIDTLINDFDVPKLYLHKFDSPLKKGDRTYDYAIIDGKQRLESMWSFIDGNIALAADFEYFKDDAIKPGELTYSELGKSFPDLKSQFDGFHLDVVVIETDELEMIEEMFSRLNESAPLTAPEKRNAFGGPLPLAIRRLAEQPFFKTALPFPNKRYRHFDLATKFLFSQNEGRVADTKKAYLDKFVLDFAGQSRKRNLPFFKTTKETLGLMTKAFIKNDPLLRQVGIVVVYYHLFRIAAQERWQQQITRKRLADFDKKREANRRTAEADITKANYDLLEFDKYAQSPNDGYALKFRLKILLKEVFGRTVPVDEL